MLFEGTDIGARSATSTVFQN